jgi:hypothetical protein
VKERTKSTETDQEEPQKNSPFTNVPKKKTKQNPEHIKSSRLQL